MGRSTSVFGDVPTELVSRALSQGGSSKGLLSDRRAGTERRAMSILDFAENPRYQLIAVALSAEDVAVIFGVKKDKLRPALEMSITLLQAELDKLPTDKPAPLTADKTASKETSREPAENAP